MTAARKDFVDAQERMLDRYGLAASSRFVDVPSIGGWAYALVSGEGPPVAHSLGSLFTSWLALDRPAE